MITDYLFMSYVAVASCWPVTLILLSVAIILLLHAERKVLRGLSLPWWVFWLLPPGSLGQQCINLL
jgi:hypothetical protein